MAGRYLSNITSVSPILETNGDAKEELGDEEESEDEDIPAEFEGEAAERIGLEKEGKFVKKLIDPKLPTKEEVETHNLMGHAEYRNWCEICVKAWGRDDAHKTSHAETQSEVPVIDVDYGFMKYTNKLSEEKDKLEKEGLGRPMIVMKCRNLKYCFSEQVPTNQERNRLT